jgi:hypothetical protein
VSVLQAFVGSFDPATTLTDILTSPFRPATAD